MKIYEAVLILLWLLGMANSQSFTPTSYSVNPNYAKSQSSTYSFTFNAITAFTANFNVHVYFPSQYSLAGVSNCAFWLNGNPVSTAVCSISNSTNEIIFTQLNIATAISSIQLVFNTSTSRYSGSSTIIFYYYNATDNSMISALTNYISLAVVNAVMPCWVTSTSAIVGDSATYTLGYSPLVTIEPNTVLQVQMQPWGPYSQSNFVTTNTTLVCNNQCMLSVPASNGNISEIIRFSSLFASASTTNGSVSLARARNPASTRSIQVTIVMLAKISATSEQSYMNCTSLFAATTPNNFLLTNFAPTITTISASNAITLRLQLLNPISSISYLRIQSSILGLTYQYNFYNQQGIQPY